MNYGKLLKLREKAGLSQEELAEKVDVSRQAISKWENGTSVPNVDNLIAMSKIYQISLDELVADDAEKTRILIITTGGTIAQYDEDGIHVSRGGGQHGFLEKVLQNPKNRDVHFDVKNLYNIDSSSCTPAHWNMMLKCLMDNHDNYDAFVITHGTNTMAQSAAALAFGIESFGKPVLLTGSQLPYGVEGADATLNFENTIRVARDHHDVLKGVYLVYNSHIIIGTRVKKVSENDYDAFSFYKTGVVAKIGAKEFTVMDKALLESYNKSFEKDGKASVFASYPTHVIGSLSEHAGFDPEDIKLLVEQGGKKAIVIRGTGVGDLSEEMLPTLKWLKESQIPVVALSQVAVSMASMDVNMPGILAREQGVIPARDMNIESTTAKIAYLLCKGVSYSDFEREFHKSYKCEISEA